MENHATEIISPKAGDQNWLWLRGGFPGSFLAKTAPASLRWRLNFINIYLEQEARQLAVSTMRMPYF